MTTKLFFLSTLFALTIGCNKVSQNHTASHITSTESRLENKFTTIEIDCDSIFKDRGLKIKLISLDTSELNTANDKFIFLVIKQGNEQTTEILRDTIESTVQKVEFVDFNNDKIKDILIQNTSDVRSNWTYNLYLVDVRLDRIKRIKGFDAIPNPNYLPQYDLIDNQVLSGRNWTSFYKIIGDSIKDFDIVIYDDEKDNSSYKVEYQKAINKILRGLH